MDKDLLAMEQQIDKEMGKETSKPCDYLNDIEESEEKQEEGGEEGQEEDLEEDGEDKDGKEPQKIKIGDKEYTEQELKALVESKNDDGEKLRAPELIEKDYAELNNKFPEQFDEMLVRYAKKANYPEIDVQSTDGTISKQANTAIVIEALREGKETGKFDKFYKFLPPEMVAQFIYEKDGIISMYKENEKKLVQEYAKHQEKESLKGFTEILTKEAKTGNEKAYLQALKENGINDKEQLKKHLEIYRKSIATKDNSGKIKEDNEKAKQKMMGSTTGKGGMTKSTSTDINKMPLDKLEKLIDMEQKRMLNKKRF